MERASETKDFKPGKWQSEINVRDFIQKNYTVYENNRYTG